MRQIFAVLAVTAGALSAAPATSQQPSAAARPETVAADTPRTNERGVAYTVPAGWTVTVRDGMVLLDPPDGDSHAALIDTYSEGADEAMEEAWRLYRPTPPPPLKLATDQPGREGWDQVRQYDYDIPPNEKRSAFALAFRRAKLWTVLLIDVSDATMSKRLAQGRLVIQSVRPKDYTREVFTGKPAHRLDAARLARLDELVELGRSEFGIPGVAIAIVQDGQVVQAKGYGVRELDKKDPVDADTLFMIASNTKALTTLLLAELVDEGKLRWDQPVTEAYPAFKLGDAGTTAATRVEHLVCACTGLPRKDLDWIFEFGKATALTEMATLAAVQPTTKFGETYQYSNLLAAAAGYVAAYVTAPKQELGQAYDAAMRARVFGPLGMKTTTFDFAQALRANHASPHSWDLDGKTAVMSMEANYSVHPLRPAGGAWSSASELIRYVQMELAKGLAPERGRRLVSEANLLKRRQPYVAAGEETTYGMGLMVDTTWGIPLVGHGGSMFGFKSNMFWLPDHGVGAVILTNSDPGNQLLGPFRRFLLEQLFDGKPEAAEDLRSAAAAARQSVAKDRALLRIPPDPAAVAGLAPRYANPALGPISVTTVQDTTTFDFGEWRSAVASRKNDDGTLSLVTSTAGLDGFVFVAGKSADGQRTLTLRDAQHEYVFTEVR